MYLLHPPILTLLTKAQQRVGMFLQTVRQIALVQMVQKSRRQQVEWWVFVHQVVII